MTKGAAEVAASSLDEDNATAEALLRSQTFQQRLDQARAARERALQSRAPDELSPATLSKPWEKQPPARQQGASEHPARRLERAAPTLFFPAGSAPATVANAAQTLQGHTVSPPPAQTRQAGLALPKSGLLRTVIGFSLGLGIGLAVAFFASRPPSPQTQPSAAAVTAASEIGKAVLVGPHLPEGILAGSVQPDVPLITPASAEGRPKVPLADVPAAIAPEMPPLQPTALAAGAPTVWWPEAGNLPAVTVDPTTPPLPGDDGPVGTLRPPQPVSISAEPEPAPNYGQEARTPPSTGAVPQYTGLSVKILGAAAPASPALTQIADALREAGFPSADIGQVSYTIRQTHVRYYHAANAKAAAAIAAQLGTEARDFSPTTPSPPEGLIEIWVAPPTSAVAQTAPPSTKAAKPAPVKAAAKQKPAAKKPPKAAVKIDAQAADAAEAAKVKARILLMLQGSGTP